MVSALDDFDAGLGHCAQAIIESAQRTERDTSADTSETSDSGDAAASGDRTTLTFAQTFAAGEEEEEEEEEEKRYFGGTLTRLREKLADYAMDIDF